MVRNALRLGLGFLAAALLGVACSSESDAPPAISDVGAGGSGPGSNGNAGTTAGSIQIPDPGPIEFDPSSGCGYTFVDAHRDPGKLYFVVDRSGSMTDVTSGVSKYTAVREALIGLVSKVGWRSDIGATVFPGLVGDQCAAGSEVFSMRAGDARSYADSGENGPVTVSFGKALDLKPIGGTPTGATLLALVPKLAKLGPNTYVILATDGGPNCNTGLSCGADRCQLNIEKSPVCKADNCCDPEQGPNYSAVNCLDADHTVAAVQALADVGVKTIVVGIPGSAVYGTLLDLMAVAGGVPRQDSPRYYRVDSLDDLEGLLLQIGDEVTVSCDVTLASAPADQSLVNVFLDTKLVPFDTADGWTWTGTDRVTLHGKSCDDLTAGVYTAVRVIEGCPSESGPVH